MAILAHEHIEFAANAAAPPVTWPVPSRADPIPASS